MARCKLIAGNWKMNGRKADSQALIEALLAKRGDGALAVDLLVCPPATLLDRIGQKLAGSPILLGAQDCHDQFSGAFTGDIAAPMIAELGASHVILGHSERRAGHGESDEIVRAKAAAALDAGLVAIICVGETEAERESGRALEVVAEQLRGSLPDGAGPETVVIAYEPVWAIGSGRTPTLDQVQEMHGHLRRLLVGRIGGSAEQLRILYGGSVKAANAAELMALPDVDGALVGGASLKAEEFWAIALASVGGKA
jgi:triosephosphate isomerase